MTALSRENSKKMTLKAISQTIKSAKSVLVLTHINPDPDAIGSSSSLVLALNSIGIKSKLYLESAPTYQLVEMTQTVPIVYQIRSDEKFDLVIALDTSTNKRLIGYDPQLLVPGGKFINIDHHLGSDVTWADLNFISDEHPAACTIVYELLLELKVKITKEIANLLLTGLMGDTGSFRFGNTNEIAFETALGLIRSGASPEYVANRLYYSVPPRVLALKGACLTGMTYFAAGRAVLLFLTHDVLERYGAEKGDTDALSDLGRSVANGVISAFIREEEAGKWKVSLRSKERRFTVNQIASKFGGGGHLQAAAFTHEGDIEPVKQTLIKEIEEYLAHA